jgi:RecA/RadA recombinase
MSKNTERIRKTLTGPLADKPIPDSDWLSFGCTLLNLAVSGRCDGGIAKGGYIWFVGDSSAGKSFFSFQLLAEAARNPNFDKHRFIYDNAENGALFEISRFFGRRVADRLEPPYGTRKNPLNSTTIEEFYYNIDDAKKADKPYIYILDSMDALDAEADADKFEEHKKAAAEGKEAKGGYGMSKAKANSQNIKRVVSSLPDHGSILIVLSQTRDKVNSPFPMKTSAGGRALRFYSHVELWCSIRGTLKRTVAKKEREYGKLIAVDVQKNRISGWEGEVRLPFLKQVGFDDLGSAIDFLVDEKHWTVSNGSIDAPEFKFRGKRESLVHAIEAKNQESKLATLTQFIWRRLQDETILKRKKRYE